VLQRYADGPTGELGYELEVLRRLRVLGWPVAEVMEQPLVGGGATWCLFSFLPGAPRAKADAKEQRSRGRLLAALHEATASMTDLGQRGGFDRCDAIVLDPELEVAVRAYERVRPAEARMMRWHIDRARERFASLDLAGVEEIVLHGDFASWNVLFDGDELSGILDFEATHMNFRVADFALAWRGHYDEVVHGYEEVHPLSDLDWKLLVPTFWSWLLMGVKEEIESMLGGGREIHGFDWQIKQLSRRTKLFGELAEPYDAGA
jgi:aminoglycoside phosphotransferase (APT) family kinase protein